MEEIQTRPRVQVPPRHQGRRLAQPGHHLQGQNVTIEEALDTMFKKNGLGYIVISKKGDTTTARPGPQGQGTRLSPQK